VKRQTLTHLDKDLERWMKVAICFIVHVHSVSCTLPTSSPFAVRFYSLTIFAGFYAVVNLFGITLLTNVADVNVSVSEDLCSASSENFLMFFRCASSV